MAATWARKFSTPPNFPNAGQELWKLRLVTILEVHIAAVAGKGVEQVGMAHRQHNRPISSTRLAHQRPKAGQRFCAVAAVDQRNQLLHDVVLVAPNGGRVQILTSSERRKAVWHHQDHRL